MTVRHRCSIGIAVVAFASQGWAARLILPQGRNAFYSIENIEFAVAELEKHHTAKLELIPRSSGSSSVVLLFMGDGGTVLVVLPSLSLAPGEYALRLDGQDAATLRVASGVCPSTMLVSQTTPNAKAPAGGANFAYSMAHEMTLLDPEGRPLENVRDRRSQGLEAFENAVAANLQSLVYHYWTGYVTHKPWGSEKSWVSPDMSEAMRLFSFHTAQRLRRYCRNILCVGTIDEPGLAWGETPTGTMASGFPNWNEREWYESRDWRFTHDIGRQSDADWMHYMRLRCSIIREALAQAKEDLKSVWPDVVFASDLYAVSAIMDGTDPLNQQVNDVTTTHVFFDWSGGPAAVPALIHLEKAHEPRAKVAHAMNGQLEGVRGPQRPLYHLLMNAMLMSGLNSNWWLNTTGMEADDLQAVNEPAGRIGPLFKQFGLASHDVAILWSFTETAMRQKAVAASEATRLPGERITFRLPLARMTEIAETEIETNAYETGRAYARPITDLHQALMRAGYPAHILDERVLPQRLPEYRVLFVNGQTFELPPETRYAIQEFVQRGGVVLADRTTAVALPNAVVHSVDMSSDAVRAREILWERGAFSAATKREASAFRTSHCFSEPIREAARVLRELLRKTPARPVLLSEDVDLLSERHVVADATLYMVLNVHEAYPAIEEDQEYPRYNFSPTITTYTLAGVRPTDAVYLLEGLDWRTVRRVKNPHLPQTQSFAAGEMKLYLVAPRSPSGLDAKANAQAGEITVKAYLRGAKLPWPVTVTLMAPDGSELCRVHRALDPRGRYCECFPIGRNAREGRYEVRVQTAVGGWSASSFLEVKRQPITPRVISDPVRVFDEPQIRRFLKEKPELLIALGNDGQRRVAEELAARFAAKGISAAVLPERQVLRKVAYPRIWSPYAVLYSPGVVEQPPPGPVHNRLRAGIEGDGTVVVDEEGSRLPSDAWRESGSLVTVMGEGLVNWLGQDQEQCFEPGVKFYVGERGEIHVLNSAPLKVRTTPEFRARWSRLWTRLYSYVGNFQLPPQIPEAYTTDSHLVMLGDSRSGFGVATIQASELLLQTVDEAYPGPGRALIQFVWSPFAVEKNVVLIGASDQEGLHRGAKRLVQLAE